MTPIELHTASGEFSRQIGQKVDGLLQAAKDESCRLEGACGALSEAAGKVDAHKAYWDESQNRGDATADEAAVAHRVIEQCAGITRNLLESGRQRHLLQLGQIQFGELVLNVLEASFEQSAKTALALQQDGVPASKAAQAAQRTKPVRISKKKAKA
jgi:hypothetical protein